MPANLFSSLSTLSAQVCEKCDVWSMGVVLWEMVALAVPFQDLSAQQILVGLMHGSLHLAVPQVRTMAPVSVSVSVSLDYLCEHACDFSVIA